jgi:predicted transcriptional regulator
MKKQISVDEFIYRYTNGKAKDLAQYLGISVQAVNTYARKLKLPYKKRSIFLK